MSAPTRALLTSTLLAVSACAPGGGNREDREPAIERIERVSRPGLRVYAGKDQIPKVLGGYGTAVLSTSKGIT